MAIVGPLIVGRDPRKKRVVSALAPSAAPTTPTNAVTYQSASVTYLSEIVTYG